MASRFENLRGWRDILSVGPKMLEHTSPNPVGGLDYLPAYAFPFFISPADPEGRADTGVLLHETTRLPPAPALARKETSSPT
jgi:hypothetical protein